MQEYLLYAIDANCCPEDDNIIMKGQCNGCKYYKGFELYNGQPSIKCSFFSTGEEDQNNN